MKPDSAPTRWFYAPKLGEVDETITLDSDESRHLLSAVRLEQGAGVTLFDGEGGIATGTLVRPVRRSASAGICIETVTRLPRLTRRIHLVSALPKGDRAATMLDMVTQLGMTDFTPLKAERSIRVDLDRQRDRWLRIFISACKQSRSGWLPRIHHPISPVDFGTVFDGEDGVIWLCDREGSPASSFTRQTGETADPFVVVVGPEGGLTVDEKSQILAVGGVNVCLGRGVLRIETAATTAVALAAISNSQFD